MRAHLRRGPFWNSPPSQQQLREVEERKRQQQPIINPFNERFTITLPNKRLSGNVSELYADIKHIFRTDHNEQTRQELAQQVITMFSDFTDISFIKELVQQAQGVLGH